MKSRLFILALLALSGAASADVERIAVQTESGLRLMWWPKINPPTGWHFDEGSSQHYAFKAFAPNDSTFSDAETVIYAKANFKPRTPDIKNVEALIEQDISGISHVVAERAKPLLSRNGQTFEVVSFSPKTDGNWERVAYGEETEYYIRFTVSSHTREGLSRALPTFQALVASYESGP